MKLCIKVYEMNDIADKLVNNISTAVITCISCIHPIRCVRLAWLQNMLYIIQCSMFCFHGYLCFLYSTCKLDTSVVFSVYLKEGTNLVLIVFLVLLDNVSSHHS